MVIMMLMLITIWNMMVMMMMTTMAMVCVYAGVMATVRHIMLTTVQSAGVTTAVKLQNGNQFTQQQQHVLALLDYSSS
jgi:hypothetical protein